MSAVPAARHLVDFSHYGGAQVPSAADTGASDEGGDESAKLDEAFARGVEHGCAEARVEFEAKLEEQRSACTVELAAARNEWAAGTGLDLANRIDMGLAELQARLAETTARILKPLLAAEVHRQAIAELQASIEALLAADPGVSLDISGPADVLDALRQQLSGRAAVVTYTTSSDSDVRVVAGQAILETQLKSWMAKLDEAVR